MTQQVDPGEARLRKELRDREGGFPIFIDPRSHYPCLSERDAGNLVSSALDTPTYIDREKVIAAALRALQ